MSRASGSDGTMSIVSRISRSRASALARMSASSVADLVDGREPLENGDEPPVLALGGLGLDDVVVEVVGAVRRA